MQDVWKFKSSCFLAMPCQFVVLQSKTLHAEEIGIDAVRCLSPCKVEHALFIGIRNCHSAINSVCDRPDHFVGNYTDLGSRNSRTWSKSLGVAEKQNDLERSSNHPVLSSSPESETLISLLQG
jgi:hypothetical protein